MGKFVSTHLLMVQNISMLFTNVYYISTNSENRHKKQHIFKIIIGW